ncbi:DUF393 domain-containing protein [Flavobacteriaceae bacterium R38]|nr:DUF393 domain-containing protein [Flavobacteriaceae bacterium R38]
MQTTQDQNIIIYDGICNLCNGVVSWIFKNTPKNTFTFVPFQSKKGQELLMLNNFPTDRLDTVILFQEDRIYTKSTAFLKIASTMSHWRFIHDIFILIPKFIRDTVYDTASRNRIKWFGSNNAMCTVNFTQKF